MMHRPSIYLLLVSITTFQLIHTFNSGISPQESTTHYGLTACALIRITANYLVSVYNVSRLLSYANSTAICHDYTWMFRNVQREIHRLRLVSELSSMIDSIATSNIDVNIDEYSSPMSHFANEKFTEGSILVGVRVNETITQFKNNRSSIGDIYRGFGQAMHTVQDFYAHSNWIEINERKPSRQMGTYTKLGLYAATGHHTCINCTRPSCAERNFNSDTISRRLLTSGYVRYSWTDPPKPKGKCSHGGPFDLSTRTDAVGYGINKDNIFSDHGSQHMLAATVALAATIEQLKSFWSKVGDAAFGQFLSFQSKDLVITLDTTSSMGPLIDMVKEIIIRILNDTRNGAKTLQPEKYIFSSFGDPDWGPLIITDDVQYLIEHIQNLTLSDGDDLPELYYHGLYDVLQVCRSNAVVFTFTDAPAKDTYLYPQVLARALELNTRVYHFHVKSVPIRRNYQVKNEFEETSDSFNIENFAIATGGTTIGVNPDRDRDVIFSFMFHHLQSRDLLLTIDGSQIINATFMVDKELTEFNIGVSSKDRLSRPSSISLKLIDPRGFIIDPLLASASNYFRLYRIKNPLDGLWRIISSQSNLHTVEISVPENTENGPMNACRIRLNQKMMRDSNVTYGSVSHSPIINQTDLVVIISCHNLSSPFQSALVRFMAQNGNEISNFHISETYVNDTIIVPVKIPDESFHLVAEMKLIDGSIIQRESSRWITPSSISITVTNQPYIFLNDTINNLTFNLNNHGRENLTVQLCITDTLQLFDENGLCQNYSVTAMTTVQGMIKIDINTSDTWVETSGSMTFSIRATEAAGKSFVNYRKIPFYLQEKRFSEIGDNETEYIDNYETTESSMITCGCIGTLRITSISVILLAFFLYHIISLLLF